MQTSRMSAFAPPAMPTARIAAPARRVCTTRAAPSFFASRAFGAPIATRVAAPPAQFAAAPAVRIDPSMQVTVVVGDSEPIESALRRFKKDVTKSGHLYELRRRRYFETNTEKRLRKAAAAKRKARMARNMKNNRARRAVRSNPAAAAATPEPTTPGPPTTAVSPSLSPAEARSDTRI